MRDQSLVYTLDEALSTIGFGNYQGLVFAYAGLGWVAESMEIMLLSFIGPAVLSEWELSSSEQSIITTVVFGGMLVGAYLWGLVSDTYGRKKAFLGVAFVTSGAGFLSSFSPNYISLIIIRCLVGIGAGGGHVYSTWFLEFVPTANRGTWMVTFSSFWTVGAILEAILAWVDSVVCLAHILYYAVQSSTPPGVCSGKLQIVMPRLGWRWLLALSSVPTFTLLLLYGFTPESPRYLCTKGRTAEAHDLLKKAALMNRTKLPPGVLISDQTEDEMDVEEFDPSSNTPLLSPTITNNKDSKVSQSSFFLLFSPELIRTTLLLWLLYFANTFSYYGIVLLTSELSTGQSKCGPLTLHSVNTVDTSLYMNTFITSLAEIPGLVLAAFMVDKVGRKLCMEILSVLGLILLLPLILHQHEILTTALLFGARMFISASFIVACIYAPEVYSTSVRAMGVGAATAIGRIGGMVCPLVAVGLVSGCQQTAAVTLFEGVIFLSGLCVLFLPFETKGRKLTDYVPVSK